MELTEDLARVKEAILPLLEYEADEHRVMAYIQSTQLDPGA